MPDDHPRPAYDAGWIEVIGARTHNLRDISVRIPRGCIVAFTGVSGSGKTSLAVDTIHAEAQLRYLEGLSPFVRQYITSRDRPQVDRVDGLGATLLVDQRRLNHNPRSTVATITGIDDYLGLLYSRLPALVPGAPEFTRELSTGHFDRFSPEGACPACYGSGGHLHADADLIITEPGKPLLDGASQWFAKWRSAEHSFIPALADHYGVDLSVPWCDQPEKFRDAVLYGTGDEVISATVNIPQKNSHAEWSFRSTQPMRGALFEVERVFANAGSESAKQRYARFMRTTACAECDGSGFGRAARELTLGGASYRDLGELTGSDLGEWVRGLDTELDGQRREVADPLISELRTRVELLSRIGLAHLGLSRQAATLSGGEVQRCRVAAQLGASLTGIVFVLDEPMSGLHPQDKVPLLEIVRGIRDTGNSILLVEHDPEIVAMADWVVDIGPAAGRGGGRVLASSAPADLHTCADSVTARYLTGERPRVRRESRPVNGDESWLTLHDVKIHNVATAEIRFPLGRLSCLTGVSGSGKSSVLTALAESALAGGRTASVGSVTGHDAVRWVTVVDQDPIGRTPRSNPATYTKAFDHIRKLFAATPEAVARGLGPSRFSFNTAGGRCDACDGHGRRLVNMHFLPDVWITCEVCGGRRFVEEVLAVTYQGMTIDDVLNLTVDESIERFGDTDQLQAALRTLRQVGLGYLQLGQSATELSGGEAQRLKLAAAIQKGRRGRGAGVVVLDEPVTGLHPVDVQRLVDAFDALLEAGNTVIIAEHDMHVAAVSDWLVDLGPGAGAMGGQVLAQGDPAAVAERDHPTSGYLRRVLAGRPLLTG